MALTAIASSQTAQTGQQATSQAGNGRTAANVWVDANNDGVCDNFANGTRPGRRQFSAGENQAAGNRGPGKGQGLTQGPGNGQGRHHGLAQGPGKRHPRGKGTMAGRGAGRGQAMMAGRGAGRGQGVAPGRGLHNGQGPAFVDANNDGVCDNQVTAPEKK